MVQKKIRSIGTSLLITGVVLGGAYFVADRLNLGTKTAFGARSVGNAAGDVLSQPIAGLTETLSKNINDIRLKAQDLFGELGSAGADVQEGFTGNRDAIGDFFDEHFSPPEKPNQRETTRPDASDLISKIIPNTERSKLKIGGTAKAGTALREVGFNTKTALSDPAAALKALIEKSKRDNPSFFR